MNRLNQFPPKRNSAPRQSPAMRDAARRPELRRDASLHAALQCSTPRRTSGPARLAGFTLIELLIVVSIISILASIAVPNLLEAQTRAKVSRVKAEFAVLAMALEAYRVDNNQYLETNARDRWRRFTQLTTPIAYITTVPKDPFLPKDKWQEDNDTDWGPRHGYYKLGCTPLSNPSRYALASNGPDLDEDSVPIRFYPGYSDAVFMTRDPNYNFVIYDPTNGTVSDGDIWRLSDRALN